MNKIKIKPKYSIEHEVQRVFYTLGKIEWYQKNNYRVRLPKGTKLMDSKKTTKKYLKELISKEYQREDYKKTFSTVQQKWNKVSYVLTKRLSAIGLKPEQTYLLFLTKYGTGGSYSLPNHIVINFQGKPISELLGTIVHEIIHLSIEHLVKKFKLNHWQKERIVDLISSKISPVLSKIQELPADLGLEKIDAIFNKFFPNIEKIIKKLKS